MSGPPYPVNPVPGSNAIGEFIIGTSPIGPIIDRFYWRTIISQYANSEILTTIIGDFFDAIEQSTNIDAFFDLIWNVETAQGHGLDVWGRIVGVSRTLQITQTENYLGFEEAAEPTYQPFNTAPFFSGPPITENFDLTDSAYRVLIYVKALANISNGSAEAINQMLRRLFPNRGNCYVRDNLDMSITYVFNFFLSPVELTIVSSGVLPKPTGVSFDVEQGII